MASTINLGSFPRMLQPGIKSIFGMAYKEHPEYYSKIFTIKKSDKNSETSTSVVGFGLARAKNSGAAFSIDYSKQGYSNKVTHVTYALGYKITMEEKEDNLYKEVIGGLTPRLARSMRTTKEIVTHDILNNAFAAGVTYGDGKSLLATDHPTETGAQSNKLSVAADLSSTSLQDAFVMIRKAKDARGLPIDLQPKDLIVPVESEFTAKVIMKSEKVVGSNWNDINLWNSEKYVKGLIVTPYLTDTDAWFMTTDCPDGLIFYKRKGITLSTYNEDTTYDTCVSAHERYSCTCNDWRSIFGSEGA